MRPILSITFFLLIMAAATDELAETKMSLSRVGAIHELPLRIKYLQSEIQARFISDEKILVMSERLSKVNPKLGISEIYTICSMVEKYSGLQGIDTELVMAIIIVESNGRIDAVSPKGAVGLMQVMPHMAEELGVKGDLFSTDTNIQLGTFILADNIRRWGYHKGIERYFWGTGAADDRYISKVLKVMEGFKG
ncbi:MAG: lytic transglycosylase domain-containing protein [Deltaproteobacteria bacterium]|nr:lytic transglycosylase domain-containing protein [Deltaproteobacteria bacterium]